MSADDSRRISSFSARTARIPRLLESVRLVGGVLTVLGTQGNGRSTSPRSGNTSHLSVDMDGGVNISAFRPSIPSRLGRNRK